VVGFHIGQDLQTAAARQVQVEQDQPWPGNIGEVAGAAQELYGLLAVAHHMQGVVCPVVRKGFGGQERIAGVVFDQQDVGGPERGLAGHRGLMASGAEQKA
jgi:hypothetical protein